MVFVALTVGGATASPQSCPNSTAPTILPEPEFTLGTTNVIRWEHVDQSCWDNSGWDGKKSTERRFDIVVTNLANGLSEWTYANGEDETDTTISGSEFPFTANTGIEGRRFSYKVRRSELVCNAGNPQTGVCIERRYRWSNWSVTVSSTQDTTPPSATLELSFGAPFTRSRSVPVTIRGEGAPAWMQIGTDPAFPCGRAGERTARCVQPFSNGAQVDLGPGLDGERQMFGRVWDDARRPAGDPGPIVFGLPPGNLSAVFRDTIVLDTTGPAFTLQASTTQVVVGGTVAFQMANPIDGVGAPGSGVNTSMARWDFGDGGQGFGLAASHAYTATGTYDVVATLGDQLGNRTQSQPLRITVTAAPVPPAPASTPTSGSTSTPTTADRTAPALTRLSVLRRRGVPARLGLRASEKATLVVQVRRLRPRPTRVVAAFSRPVRAGRGGIALGRALARPGRYRITIAARDAAGNVSRSRTLIVVTRAR